MGFVIVIAIIVIVAVVYQKKKNETHVSTPTTKPKGTVYTPAPSKAQSNLQLDPARVRLINMNVNSFSALNKMLKKNSIDDGMCDIKIKWESYGTSGEMSLLCDCTFFETGNSTLWSAITSNDTSSDLFLDIVAGEFTNAEKMALAAWNFSADTNGKEDYATSKFTYPCGKKEIESLVRYLFNTIHQQIPNSDIKVYGNQNVIISLRQVGLGSIQFTTR